MLLAGCMEITPDNENMQEVSFHAEIGDDIATRTTLGEGNKVLWSTGDEIVVFEKTTAANRHRLTEASAGSTSGEFTRITDTAGETALSHNVAFYPYCDAACMPAGKGSYIFTDIYFPALQEYVRGSFAQKSFPMVAVSEGDELSFRNVGGALKLQLRGTGNVQTIKVTGNGNEYIAGKADVIVYVDGSDPKANMQDTAQKTVTLNCGGVALDQETPTDFIIILPPVTFDKGFSVTVTADTGEEMTISAKVSNSVRRSAILRMPEIIFDPEEVDAKVLAECPFRRGINISDWLLHESEDAIRANLYTEQDFHNLRSLGFDAVRLPVDFEAHAGEGPDYVISEYVLECIDRAVNWAENADMYIIIDNHSYLGESFPNDGSGSAILKKVFMQLAQRYKDRSEKVMYELFNEPSESDLSLLLTWSTLQRSLIDIIRSVDKKHTIVVSGFGSSIDNLDDIRNLKDIDRNLLYTFHFYAPTLFTHQGANWNSSPMQYLEGPVPFPYDASRMPAKPSQFAGSYNEVDYDEYSTRGNVEYLAERLRLAIDFSKSNNVPIYCGEWGVLNRLAAQDDYCYYHKVVREILEEYNIGWTLWAYRDDFSIFNRTGGYAFENNLNVGLLEALDLNIPPGYTSDMPSEIVFYDDVPASFIKPSTYNYDSEMTFDSKYDPCTGERCIQWVMGGKYASVTFEIWPVTDLSEQAFRDYELSFMIRSESAFAAPLTVRFIEYDGDGNTAWRYGVMIDNSMFASDGEWHEVILPMSSFVNQGGYKGTTWLNADASRPCDWTKINKLEFAVEARTDLIGHEIFLDDIKIASTDGRLYIDGFEMNPVKWEW